LFAPLGTTIGIAPAGFPLDVIVYDIVCDIAECTKQRHQIGQSSTRITSGQGTREQNLAKNLMRAIGVGGLSPRPEVAACANIVAQFVDPDATLLGYVMQCSIAVTY
jgi:hypothetical protein